jgi:hypothetical protein
MSNLDEYRQFIAQKRPIFGSHGIKVDASQVHPSLKPFQRDIVVWAVGKGRAATFADTGLGKTRVSLEWARLLGQRTIFVAPLSVARQTVREARKIDLEVRYVRSPEQVTSDHNLWITNYEMIEKFDPAQFGAVVLDESSILKAINGKTRRTLTEMFSRTPYRLCCTATPAPNDLVEIGNHAEFLGISTAAEMKAMFFINANIDHYIEFAGVRMRRKGSNAGGQEWRLRHHAEEPFYKWMASWAMSVRRPSDLGYSDDGYILPPLTITPEWIDYTYIPDDRLVFTGFTGIKDFLALLRKTVAIRCQAAANRVNADSDQWIVWTYLEEESTLAHSLIPDSVEVKGSDSPERKAEMIEAFQDGKFRVLVTKPDIAGFGMNFQNATQQYWVTVRYSWEEWYQAIRRSYRFLQDRPVEIYASLTPQMQEVWDTIQAKEKVAAHMSEQLISHVRKFELEELHDGAAEKKVYEASKQMRLPVWLKAAQMGVQA